MIRLKLAEQKDLSYLIDVHARSTSWLNEQGIFQWTDAYPSPTTIQVAINNNCQFLLWEDSIIMGSVVLNEEQDEEWRSIPWTFPGKILVIHALVIDPKIQGKGYGQQGLTSIEAYASKNGYIGIRLDVFPYNQRAVQLYERNGYRYVGDVYFNGKPKGYERYKCYEKKIVTNQDHKKKATMHE